MHVLLYVLRTMPKRARSLTRPIIVEPFFKGYINCIHACMHACTIGPERSSNFFLKHFSEVIFFSFRLNGALTSKDLLANRRHSRTYYVRANGINFFAACMHAWFVHASCIHSWLPIKCCAWRKYTWNVPLQAAGRYLPWPAWRPEKRLHLAF